MGEKNGPRKNAEAGGKFPRFGLALGEFEAEKPLDLALRIVIGRRPPTTPAGNHRRDGGLARLPGPKGFEVLRTERGVGRALGPVFPEACPGDRQNLRNQGRPPGHAEIHL